MSVKTKREPAKIAREFGGTMENCCICRTPTPDRCDENDVALCAGCASRAYPEDIPTKAVWLRRERLSHEPTEREGSQGKPRPDQMINPESKAVSP